MAIFLLKTQWCKWEILSASSYTFKTITWKFHIVKLYSPLVITIDIKFCVKSRLLFKKIKNFTVSYKTINGWNANNHLSDYLSVVFNLHGCTFKWSLITKNPVTLNLQKQLFRGVPLSQPISNKLHTLINTFLEKTSLW